MIRWMVLAFDYCELIVVVEAGVVAAVVATVGSVVVAGNAFFAAAGQ